jgi:hypothetical protein
MEKIKRKITDYHIYGHNRSGNQKIKEIEQEKEYRLNKPYLRINEIYQY